MKMNKLSKVMSCINDNTEHMLYQRCAYKYYTDFINSLIKLEKAGLLDTERQFNSFYTKMQLGNKYDPMKYYQGISEILFWIFAIQHNLEFSLEEKLSLDNNCDVDVQLKKEGYTFNLEIKCPKFESVSDDTLNINTSFRAMSKEKLEELKDKMNADIIETMITNSEGKFTNAQFKKIKDNTLVDFLKSGQSKFTYTDEKTINVLVVAVPSSNMQDYWGYLYNIYSGLFTESSFCPHEEYEKVDVVYLTNLVTGHMAPHDDFNSWQLGSYCNLLCINPFSKKMRDYHNNQGEEHQRLLQLLPNDNVRFEKFYDDLTKECEKQKLPLQGLLFSQYLSDNYPLLWKR